MTDLEIEQELRAKGLTDIRVTPEYIDQQIVGADYHQFPGSTVTVCALRLRNGYHVVGHSACASVHNFDEELGRKIAYEEAKRQIWPLEGYKLTQLLHEEANMNTGVPL